MATIGIQDGIAPNMQEDLNAPKKTISSAINPENPGKPSDAKNAIQQIPHISAFELKVRHNFQSAYHEFYHKSPLQLRRALMRSIHERTSGKRLCNTFYCKGGQT